jgi:hypothetical protein
VALTSVPCSETFCASAKETIAQLGILAANTHLRGR